MKNIGRRLFASALPAAPLTVGKVAGDVLQAPQTERNYVKCGTIEAPSMPQEQVARREKLIKARDYIRDNYGYRDPLYTRRRKNNWTTLDPNIMALKSVSDQHKIHMHMAADDAMDREADTWQDSILRMFGLTDKRDKHELF